MCRVATVREKYLENEILSRSGKFVHGHGKFERTWKVREFENKWLWQAVSRKFIILFKWVKDVLSDEMVKAHLPPHWGLLL